MITKVPDHSLLNAMCSLNKEKSWCDSYRKNISTPQPFTLHIPLELEVCLKEEKLSCTHQALQVLHTFHVSNPFCTHFRGRDPLAVSESLVQEFPDSRTSPSWSSPSVTDQSFQLHLSAHDVPTAQAKGIHALQPGSQLS